MKRVVYFLLLWGIFVFLADHLPYKRYMLDAESTRISNTVTTLPQFNDCRDDLFTNWLYHIVENDKSGDVSSVFQNYTLPEGIQSFGDIFDCLDPPDPRDWEGLKALLLEGSLVNEAQDLFGHLGYAIDPRCTTAKYNWWYRSYDGGCNWMRLHETSCGQVGTAKARDYNQNSYADGISEPRGGPNPRAVSNAFFKRKKTIYYEHTPLLLGLVEFIMHDVSFSQDSTTQYIEVAMPPNETVFEPHTKLRVYRTLPVLGTGTSKGNPRENVNMATTWLDLSSLYGSTQEVAMSLRSFSGGRLLVHEVVQPDQMTMSSYLPFNTMGIPTFTRSGVDPKELFAGGDPRTNEDWMLIAVHTLMLREHNRLCGILARQHTEYNDEQLYQTVRLLMSAKYAMIANSYQIAYWTDDMPWPQDDGFPLYRQMYGESVLNINPAVTYPWPLVTKGGKPMVVSAEMAIVYRFHEFIIPSFQIKDANNKTLWEQDVFAIGFNATGFIGTGLENVLRGMVATHIPNFKSGVDESFRSSGKYKSAPFDIVVSSIVHEREQGLPTFNQYFLEYNKQGKRHREFGVCSQFDLPDPFVAVPIRKNFEDFSSDPEMVAHLRRLYKSLDEVDLVVGVQLDEEYFPGTTVPKTALIISLFSLFGMANSDRFSIGFAVMRCVLVGKPWDCQPSNALEELLWKPNPTRIFPKARILDSDWIKELGLEAHGANLLWRLVVENTDINCLQQRPLFPQDPVTNPVLCTLPPTETSWREKLLTIVEVLLAILRQISGWNLKIIAQLRRS